MVDGVWWWWWSGGMESSWVKTGMVLKLTAGLLKGRWGCEVAPQDALPSEPLEKMVDHWCCRLAGNLMLPIDPPAAVRPWLLARLVSGCAQCSVEAAAGNPCPGISPETARNMLVEGWHELLRERWSLLVLEDLE